MAIQGFSGLLRYAVRRRFLSVMCAVVLLTSLLSGPVTLAAVPAESPGSHNLPYNPPPDTSPEPSPIQAASSSPKDVYAFSIFLPAVLRTEAPSPGDDIIVSWLDYTEGGNRKVLLTWREPVDTSAAALKGLSTILAINGYVVERQVGGSGEWEKLGETKFPDNAAELTMILGADLMAQLGYDLRDSPKDPPLTPQEVFVLLRDDPALKQLVASQYFQVGLATGTGFVDENAPKGIGLSYRVTPKGGVTSFPTAKVPALTLPAPETYGLQEVWTGPNALGVRPSIRPDDAEERYTWLESQKYRSWDGTVYLIWEVPEKDDGKSLQFDDQDYTAMNYVGYRVYRAAHGTQNWQSVNPRKQTCVSPAYCELLITIFNQTGYNFPAYNFKEDLRTVYSDPADIYKQWDYKVCSVNAMREDIACTSSLAVNVRELMPPTAVDTITATVNAEQTRVTIDWKYFDELELSYPLRFYVTRSPTLTLPSEQWIPIYPPGETDPYIEVSSATTVTLSIEDKPPVNEVNWYRVQVRDNAGNWSAPGQAVKGALYDRTGPTLGAIPQYKTCAVNRMPKQITGLDPSILQVVLYRGFSSTGPWHLVRRFTVNNGRVTIDDDYVPPNNTVVYYKVEAIDGHGNVSNARSYCAQLTGGNMDPGPNTVTMTLEIRKDEAFWQAVPSPEEPGANPPDTWISVTYPGDGGSTTDSQALTETLTGDITDGSWVNISTYISGTGFTGIPQTASFRNTNNYLDTDRHLTYLGDIMGLEWMTDTVPGDYVRIQVTDIDDYPTPPVTVFRRISGGNWMQVTGVHMVQPQYIEDWSDLSVDQEYQYVVIMLSPTSKEMLGFWGPNKLAPLDATGLTMNLTMPIDPVAGLPGDCDVYRRRPSIVGMPLSIVLTNGWIITNTAYFETVPGTNCPEAMDVFDPNHAYGDGDLTNGFDHWPVNFFDIGVNSTTGVFLTGKIVASINQTLPASASRFVTKFGRIEFLPASNRAEVTIPLPDNIRVDPGEGDRVKAVFGAFPNVSTSLRFNPLALDSGSSVIDENLPWQLHNITLQINWHALTFAGTTTTSYRIYTPLSSQPDNNLGYMGVEYESTNVVVTPDGTDGTFETAEPISYTTSFPALIQVQAHDGADVVIADSTITGGKLYNSSAKLMAYDSGTSADFARTGKNCSRIFIDHYALCEMLIGTLHEREYTMAVWGSSNPIHIGPEGYLTATVTLNQHPRWPSFEVETYAATLFVAGAAFADNATDPLGVMPTENAWRRLPNLATGGTLDPGINISSDDLTTLYTFYNPPEFDGSAMDLYIRRGGVSGHLIIPAGGATTNSFGYEDRVQGIELMFIDNGIADILQFDTDLYLPYPSDVTLLLSADQPDPAQGVPASGFFREDMDDSVLHKYWNFTETLGTWQYSQVSGDYEGALGHQDAIFALLNSTASIDGLGQMNGGPDSAPVDLGFCSEWLPDGDIGALRLDALAQLQYRVSGFNYVFSGLKLSRFYSTPMNHSSLPSTAGIDLGSNIDGLPDELLSHGALTPQSLKSCSTDNTVGCGLVLIDGNVAVEYFGEAQRDTTLALQDAGAVNLDVDDLVGVFPLAVNWFYTVTKQVGIFASAFPWSWPLVDRVLDVPLPVKFLGNTNGGVFVALSNLDIFPEEKIFNSDVAAVISMGWTPSLGFQDKIGIFLGYAASQAAFRALAMNRPTFAGGIIPYDQWVDVESDIQAWAAKFGYMELAEEENDAVDLARDTWDLWCGNWSGNTCTDPKDFAEAYWIVQPTLKALHGREAYGVGGLKPGDDLLPTNAAMNTGAMAAVFRPDGLGIQIDKLEGGLQMQYDVFNYDIWITDIAIFLRVDWVTAEMNRDGEIFFYGDTYINLIGNIGVDGEFYGFAVQDDNDDWLVEGTVDLETIGISGVSGLDLAGEFGSGTRNGQGVSYVGVRGEGYYLDYRVGGGFLYGGIYKQSQILRDVGYGELLDTLGSDDVYTGFYAFLSGDFPMAEGLSCVFSAVAAGELQLWYYWSNDVYGGILSGSVYATVACIISGRGQVDLEYAHLDNGGSVMGRTCHNPHCDAYAGDFWIAVGVGWCSPSTWDSWRQRWWGDSWCYTFGVYVDISYLSPGGWDWHTDFDYE